MNRYGENEIRKVKEIGDYEILETNQMDRRTKFNERNGKRRKREIKMLSG